MKKYSFHEVQTNTPENTSGNGAKLVSFCVSEGVYSNETPSRALRDHFLQSVTGGTFDWVGRDTRTVQEIFTLTNGRRYTVEEYPC